MIYLLPFSHLFSQSKEGKFTGSLKEEELLSEEGSTRAEAKGGSGEWAIWVSKIGFMSYSCWKFGADISDSWGINIEVIRVQVSIMAVAMALPFNWSSSSVI